ncbi:hypothetical protein JXO59_12955 [candidate division KSB1 bacterium]|nr:hypothetical protein [candidate division KSB1 bacterium]
MAKDRSFQSKLARAQAGPSHVCPVCKEAIVTYYVVQTDKNKKKDSWRFKDNYLPICKCNEKEYLS